MNKVLNVDLSTIHLHMKQESQCYQSSTYCSECKDHYQFKFSIIINRSIHTVYVLYSTQLVSVTCTIQYVVAEPAHICVLVDEW